MLPKRRGCLIARLLRKVIAREQSCAVHIDIADWVFSSLKEGWLGPCHSPAHPSVPAFGSCPLYVSSPQPPLLIVTAKPVSLGEKIYFLAISLSCVTSQGYLEKNAEGRGNLSV